MSQYLCRKTLVKYRKYFISYIFGRKKILQKYLGCTLYLIGVQISFEGFTKAKSPKKPSKLICTPNKKIGVLIYE